MSRKKGKKRKEMKKNPLKKALKYMPYNYPVAGLNVDGGPETVVRFVNLSKGIAHFINENNQLSMFDANEINGIIFGAAEALEPEEPAEEEEA